MKKFVVACAIATCFGILMGFAACASAEIYPQTFIVGDIDRPTDAVGFIDYNGHVWTWEGSEDWMIGDIAAAIMDDNGTEIIYDDEIVALRYTGHIEDWR